MLPVLRRVPTSTKCLRPTVRLCRSSAAMKRTYSDTRLSMYKPKVTRAFSAQPEPADFINRNERAPTGELFRSSKKIGPSLVGMTGSIQQTFGPRANAEAMLTCGGESLARHASFDPDYLRAQGWIRHHAVGPAVLSPILISGLTGALAEAAFPQAISLSQTMQLVRPLIVGSPVDAKIEVTHVLDSRESNVSCMERVKEEREKGGQSHGYQVDLNTTVSRVRDGATIAQGTHSLWIPDYLHM